MTQQFFIGQVVVDHDLSPLQQVFAAQSNQARITGTGADEIDLTRSP